MVINVEYNQLDPLLRATGYPDGDVNDETGFSPFPGNINQVCFWPGFVFYLYWNFFFFQWYIEMNVAEIAQLF